ncbi:hypothetical protein ES703_88477 [subsurface metagenome]
MAEISGENGAVYFNEGLTVTAPAADDISYSTGDSTITSATIDFGTTGVGFKTGMLFDLSECGSTVNERIYTINTVVNKVITTIEAISSGGTDTGTPVFLEEEPGIEVLGFFNWTLSYVGDALEVTSFSNSSEGRAYIPGLTSWTATADKHFLTADNEVDDWVGQTCEIRLFIDYVATPSTGSGSTGRPSQYWKGDTVVTGLDETTPVDALVDQSISFQGDRALTLKTQTQPWSSGISA